ncbi:MAG: hypothetical protein HY267_01815, partial [Deltaproteobacteria bacterium]|nr:hypothetical protein [Deltaproteobacteria bacterium]
MKRTRLSLFYLAGYLVPSGILLMLAPQFALKLLFSTGDYGDWMPRLVGVVLFALGVVIVQIIRYRLEVLYTTTLFVRAVILLTLIALYISSRDPFFLVLVGVVGFGVALTTTSYVLDRRSGT